MLIIESQCTLTSTHHTLFAGKEEVDKVCEENISKHNTQHQHTLQEHRQFTLVNHLTFSDVTMSRCLIRYDYVRLLQKIAIIDTISIFFKMGH